MIFFCFFHSICIFSTVFVNEVTLFKTSISLPLFSKNNCNLSNICNASSEVTAAVGSESKNTSSSSSSDSEFSDSILGSITAWTHLALRFSRQSTDSVLFILEIFYLFIFETHKNGVVRFIPGAAERFLDWGGLNIRCGVPVDGIGKWPPINS